MISTYDIYMYFINIIYESIVISIFACAVLRSCLESYISAFLCLPLDQISFEEVSDLFAEEYFILDLNRVCEIFVLHYFSSGLETDLVEHGVVVLEGFHHGVEQAIIEHQSLLVCSVHFRIILTN